MREPSCLVSVDTDLLDYSEQAALDRMLRNDGWEPEEITPNKRYYIVRLPHDEHVQMEFKAIAKMTLEEPGATSARTEGTFNQIIPERDYM